jgi:hypothetical protein
VLAESGLGVGEVLLQVPAGVVGLTLDRPLTALQQVRDLSHGQVLQKAQDGHGPLSGW